MTDLYLETTTRLFHIMSLLARAPLMRQSQQALMRARPAGPIVPRGAHAYHVCFRIPCPGAPRV